MKYIEQLQTEVCLLAIITIVTSAVPWNPVRWMAGCKKNVKLKILSNYFIFLQVGKRPLLLDFTGGTSRLKLWATSVLQEHNFQTLI